MYLPSCLGFSHLKQAQTNKTYCILSELKHKSENNSSWSSSILSLTHFLWVIGAFGFVTGSRFGSFLPFYYVTITKSLLLTSLLYVGSFFQGLLTLFFWVGDHDYRVMSCHSFFFFLIKGPWYGTGDTLWYHEFLLIFLGGFFLHYFYFLRWVFCNFYFVKKKTSFSSTKLFLFLGVFQPCTPNPITSVYSISDY